MRALRPVTIGEAVAQQTETSYIETKTTPTQFIPNHPKVPLAHSISRVARPIGVMFVVFAH
jgi:hypothetical protein